MMMQNQIQIAQQQLYLSHLARQHQQLLQSPPQQRQRRPQLLQQFQPQLVLQQRLAQQNILRKIV